MTSIATAAAPPVPSTSGSTIDLASASIVGNGNATSRAYISLSSNSTLSNAPTLLPRVKEDILRIIEQYLGDEGYAATKLVLHDEASLKGKERDDRVNEGRKLKRAILEGDWAEVDNILSKPFVRTQKALLYSVYKQQFLEHIEYRELQKAFTLLNKRLKPLERFQPTRTEFQDLCYLLSAKTVHDAPSFKNWEGVTAAREKLAEMFGEMLEGEREERDESAFVPKGRLMTLLEQAVSYQVSCARYKPETPPTISSLLQDFSPFVIPNTLLDSFAGHTANVKCLRFVGSSGRHFATGSSDRTLRIWDSLSPTTPPVILRGHTSRIWDVDSTSKGDRILSASADRTVKVWSWRRQDAAEGSESRVRATLEGNEGDVYAARWHPMGNHIATGGYDRIVRLYDVESRAILKTFTGHALSVSSVLFNPLGNLIVSGSKDGHVRFWDTVSGLNIRTLTAQVGEVTSVDMNDVYLLTSSRDNSIRLWDVRMLRPLKRYKAHSNTSQNFVRATFAHSSLIVSGSDDGLIYLWDRESTEVVQTLEGHDGVVFGATWNGRQGLLASYGSDFEVKTWEYVPDRAGKESQDSS
ncbi:WD40 repeat-like protein [Meredithblackwellia eburnea MCA 4105]